MSREVNEEVWNAFLELDKVFNVLLNFQFDRNLDSDILLVDLIDTSLKILLTKTRYKLSIKVYNLFENSLNQFDIKKDWFTGSHFCFVTLEAKGQVKNFKHYLHQAREAIDQENRAEQLNSELNSISSNLNGNERVVALLQRRLLLLQEKQAVYGINTDPAVVIEIQDIEAQIKKLSM